MLLIVGLLCLPSCTDWHPIAVPGPTNASRLPATVRVTLISQKRWELDRPYFKGDSLIGMHRSRYAHPRLAFQRSEILQLEDLRENTRDGERLLLGIVLGTFLIVGAAVASSICPGGCG